MIKTLEWSGNSLRIIDQSQLPQETVYLECRDYQTVAAAIKSMKIRGAPAIGVAAGFGVVLAAMQGIRQDLRTEEFISFLHTAAKELATTRPTAVNLFWALERMLATLEISPGASPRKITDLLTQEALNIYTEDIKMNKSIGDHGLALIPQNARILTHCNAGALATAGYGTALGVIRSAHKAQRNISVWVDETRPLLQGSRLTAWELWKEEIPSTLVADNMAGYLMQQGKVDLVLVGADRITANGDVANKIGTYSLAVLAQAHKIPFYVAAPWSTVDLSLLNGHEIIIEERSAQELREIRGNLTAPPAFPVYNPAFDLTPHNLITAIITDVGIAEPLYTEQLQILARKRERGVQPVE